MRFSPGSAGAGELWLAAAVVIGSVAPFTLIVIKLVNDALLRNRDAASQVDALLTRWGYLHWARIGASGLAFLLCLIGYDSRAQF